MIPFVWILFKKTDDDVLSEDEDDLSYGWFENPLEFFDDVKAGSSLDALNAVLSKPRKLSVDTQTEIREVIETATMQVEKATILIKPSTT